MASQCHGWARAGQIELRDCVLLLPFAQLLAPARQAFAAGGGWQPRIETTQTLAGTLGPPTPLQPLQLAFDPAADRLVAQRLLLAQSNGAALSRHDPRAFAHAVGLLVETAQSLARAASAVPPAQREAHWAQARRALPPLTGPGGRERWLARIALEWAAVAPVPRSDRLFELRPAAWIALQAGGADPLVEALLEAGEVPALLLDADAPAAVLRHRAQPSRRVCDSFEDEAQCAAAQVLSHLAAGRRPVALVGQDRALVRRVRALLERAAVRLDDETGWTLSTTRAAAQVMLALRAAGPRARSDDLLDWLKTLPTWPGQPADALQRLEQRCRQLGLGSIEGLQRLPEGSSEARLWLAVRRELARLAGPARGVDAWLAGLRGLLEASGAWTGLQADEAGRAVIAALRLDGRADAAWREVSVASALTLERFVDWADQVLEQGSFRLAAGEADVVIVPMAQLLLRPFEAVVWPGADDRHLGTRPAPHPLLEEASLALFGLPDAAQRRTRERRLFDLALLLPRVSFLRRQEDEGEPLADSPWLQAIELDLAEQGRGWRDASEARVPQPLAPAPVARPLPSAAALLPERISASAAESLRECPYRFFARHLLRLREDEELEDEVEKRDYGTWLHAVLHRFHAGRGEPADAAIELARLQAIASEMQQAQGLPDETFLPFAASFATLAPHYLAWLHARDAAGQRWRAGEQERQVPLAGVPGLSLQGVIDRIDDGIAGSLELIDYKTGSVDGLKRRVREPLEDTQLAFYAALLGPESDRPMRAMYLALDDGQGIRAIEHPQVAHSAAQLVQGLAGELGRVRAGAVLPALGEGRTCDYCEARGLCRRDHWSMV